LATLPAQDTGQRQEKKPNKTNKQTNKKRTKQNTKKTENHIDEQHGSQPKTRFEPRCSRKE